jgi:hypothetical protein
MGRQDHGSRPDGAAPEVRILGLGPSTVRRIIAAGTLEAALPDGAPGAGADAAPEQSLPPALASLVEGVYARSTPPPQLAREFRRMRIGRRGLRDGIRRGRGRRRVPMSSVAFALVSFAVFLFAFLAIGVLTVTVIGGGIANVVLLLP